jgi:hypothetical protein
MFSGWKKRRRHKDEEQQATDRKMQGHNKDCKMRSASMKKDHTRDISS